MKQGNLEEAINEFHTAIRLNPDYAVAHNDLGNVLTEQGKRSEAIAEYRTAIRLNPDYAEAHSNLGIALLDHGKAEEAIAEHRTAIRLKPDSAEAHSNLGNALREQGKLAEAIAECRTAIRLKPDLAEAHDNLGMALQQQGNLEAAIAEYRIALRLKPDSVLAHDNLGAALGGQGKLEEAIAEFRTAIRLKPDFAGAHYNLGNALSDQGKLAEAIDEYRTATRLKPAVADVHCNLGHALRRQGQFADALAELKQGHELGSKISGWRYPSADWVRQAEQLVALDRKLPAILTGKARPSDAAESLGMAEICYIKRLHGASARLWSEAFQAQPKLRDDMRAQNRYNAACAAALAGWGQGKDDPPLDDAAKTRWRKQSMEWLTADLAAWSKILDSGTAQTRQFISQTLQHWKVDSDLAGIREDATLAKLPAEEQKSCRALWLQVDSLLKKTRAATPKGIADTQTVPVP